MDEIRSMAVRQRRLVGVMGLIFLFSLFVTFPGRRRQEWEAVLEVLIALSLSAVSVILVLRLARRH